MCFGGKSVESSKTHREDFYHRGNSQDIAIDSREWNKWVNDESSIDGNLARAESHNWKHYGKDNNGYTMYVCQKCKATGKNRGNGIEANESC